MFVVVQWDVGRVKKILEEYHQNEQKIQNLKKKKINENMKLILNKCQYVLKQY